MLRTPHLSGPSQQYGVTLVDMMVAMVVGLLIVLAATALLQNARATYQDIDDNARVHETGRLALDHLARVIRQTGHLPWESLRSGTSAPQQLRPALYGLDNSRNPTAIDPAKGIFPGSAGNGINGSDVLALGFFGIGKPVEGSVVSCSGASAPPPDNSNGIDDTQRTWVIYSIAYGAGNEPELRCRYHSKNGAWTSDGVARGVEAMHVLYGVFDDKARTVRWMRAGQMNEALWRQVALVRIGLLVRGRHGRLSNASPRRFDVLPPDPQASFTEAAGDQRARAVFQTTIFLRNKPPDQDG